jgi:hypothetical protein
VLMFLRRRKLGGFGLVSWTLAVSITTRILEALCIHLRSSVLHVSAASVYWLSSGLRMSAYMLV